MSQQLHSKSADSNNDHVLRKFVMVVTKHESVERLHNKSTKKKTVSSSAKWKQRLKKVAQILTATRCWLRPPFASPWCNHCFYQASLSQQHELKELIMLNSQHLVLLHMKQLIRILYYELTLTRALNYLDSEFSYQHKVSIKLPADMVPSR